MLFVYLFLSSFVTNLIWENLHAKLYIHHLNQVITERTLIVASLGDAIIITAVALAFMKISFLSERLWISIPLFIAISIIIELHALSVHRWAYAESMPLIPYLNVGVSPTVQLAVTGFILFLLFIK
jgi:hypothetical protein